MSLRVLLRPAARDDLTNIYRFIAVDSPANAKAYVARIRLADFSERGVLRSELGSGVRLLSFERRVVILYRIDESNVRILRILYGGQKHPENLTSS